MSKDQEIRLQNLPSEQKSGQRKYQVNLRSHSAPIQVTLMSRGSDSVPVVLPLPPTDDICLMPTPPSTPASLQRLPLLNSACSTSTTTPLYCSQDSISVDLIDELMSANGEQPNSVDYSFNLDDSEGVSDLFDVQILNY
uniref:E2F transcription factor 5 n=1 Tax=Nothobranchius furzeri TaxID=105023 RepID=A0A8C6LEK4_NOTFU